MNANPRMHRTSQNSFWVVVADEAQAIFYGRETRHAPDLVQLFRLTNDAARKKSGELLSDRGGRSFDSFGEGRHTMAREKTDPKRHAAIRFAKQVAERIAKSIHTGKCREFSLVAAPRFLGELRDAMSSMAGVEPFSTADKEMVGRDAGAIRDLVDGK